jgi:hypothetical protein
VRLWMPEAAGLAGSWTATPVVLLTIAIALLTTDIRSWCGSGRMGAVATAVVSIGHGGLFSKGCGGQRPMRTLILTLLVGTLLAGCGKSRPTYQLTIGTETLDLTVHDDPKLIQDDLVGHIRPIWDELTTGASVTFQYQRIAPVALGRDMERKAKAKFGDNVEITTTVTACSPVWRFFKDRNGDSGMEQLDQGKEPSTLFSGPGVDWGFVEWYLRDDRFSIQTIRTEIQEDRSE